MLATTRPAILQHVFGLALGLAVGTMSGPVALAFYPDCPGSVGDLDADTTFDATNVKCKSTAKLTCPAGDGEQCCFFFRTALQGPFGAGYPIEDDNIDLYCNEGTDATPRTIREVSTARVSGKWEGRVHYYTVDCTSYDKSWEFSDSSEVTIP